MEFLVWHYTQGVNFYLKRMKYTFASVYQYFSLTLLITHLFSPWKRLVVDEMTPGLNFAKRFQVVSFNFVSRFIGAFARIVLFFVGVVALVFTAVLGTIGFVLWLAIPVLSYSLYTLHRREPAQVCASLLVHMKATNDPGKYLCDSVPGIFIQDHLGLTREEGYSLFSTTKPFAPQTTIGLLRELVSSFIADNPEIEKRLLEKNISVDDVLLAAQWWDTRRSNKVSVTASPPVTTPGLGRNLLFGYTPTLDKFSVDMAAPQLFSQHLIGREAVVKRIERVLGANTSVVLHGQPGVGKRTVLYEFAKRAREGLLGHELSYARVLEFDFTPIVSGSTDISQKKMLLSQALLEAASAGNVILVIRDLHRVTSTIEGVEMTDLFERYLESRKLKIIALSGSAEYERFIAPNARLRKFFETIEVVPMPKEEALMVILEAARTWEKKLKIFITIQAVVEILDGSDSYITEAPFPEKAIELLDAVLAYAQEQGKMTVLAEDVRAVLSEKTGISLVRLNQEEKDKLGQLEILLHERLVGQELAVDLIAKILRAKMSGVVHTKRPLGSFLFLGPTGVGKTETARALAKVYFGSDESILRFNMSEYAGSEGLERLIGSHIRNIPGELSVGIKNKPASLLLLDEIEKAPREILNLFLSILDEGTLTDAFGNIISCSHLFIIGTSNAGADTIRSLVQSKVTTSEIEKKLIDTVIEEKIFSPEFINRFDGVIVYTPLSMEDLHIIAGYMLSDMVKGIKQKNIDVTFSPGAVEKIVSLGYEPALGARPMRRVIELAIGDLLGRAMLAGEIKSGDRVIIKPDGGKAGFVWEPM